MNRKQTAATVLHPRAVALAAATLVAALHVSPVAAQAQTPATAAKADDKKAEEKKVDDKKVDKADDTQREVVEIRGTRASLESAMSRKRMAATVTDHIVAEDINQFPDKNIGEAMSRVTGVQLGRDGDSGEGTSVSIRGQDPSWTRVEINGMTQSGLPYGSANQQSDLREVASELIQSLEVVKGVLPNIAEGGIGGTVRIVTRKPLDFKERTVVFSAADQYVSNLEKHRPRLTLLAADKFMDGRLGLMLNATFSDDQVRGDVSANGSPGNGTFNMRNDWQTDPNQTKTYVSSNAQSAAVTTKAGCASLVSTTAGVTTANLKTDCEDQYRDFAPGALGYNLRERSAKRTSVEATAQYKFNNNTNGWLTIQPNEQNFAYRNFDFRAGLATDDNGTGTAAIYPKFAVATGGVAPVYNADGSVRTAGTCGTRPTATSQIPATLDANHMVTGFTYGDCMNVAGVGGRGILGSATREQSIDNRGVYLQLGLNHKEGPWKFSGFVGDSRQGYVENNFNSNLSMNVAGLKVEGTDVGVPRMALPATFDWYNPNSYSGYNIDYSATKQQRRESVLQFDGERRLDELPVLSRVLFGARYTHQTSIRWGRGQSTYSDGTTTVTTQPNYGRIQLNFDPQNPYDAVPASQAAWTNPASLFGTAAPLISSRSITRSQMQQLLNSTLIQTPGTFFGDYPKFGGTGVQRWMAPSMTGAFATGLLNGASVLSIMNDQHLNDSVGSDGNMYRQTPDFNIQQNVLATYVRADGDIDLPYGMVLSGNAGARVTTAYVTSTSKATIPALTASGTVSSTPAQVLRDVKNSYTDVLPSANLALQALGGKLISRLGWGKVMTRPDIDKLTASITCTTDATDGIDNCSGGNPYLQPYRATKTDLSFEYYHNRDTLVNLALYRTKITSDVGARVYLGQFDIFGDGVLRDLSGTVNQPGATTKGVELGVRSAFTFLPGWASGFGGNFNITHNTFKYLPGNEIYGTFGANPLTSNPGVTYLLPRAGMSTNTYNVGLWYDKYDLVARLDYAYRDSYYAGSTVTRSGIPLYNDATGWLDAKVQYRFTKNFTMALEGKNLGRQAVSRYAQVPEVTGKLVVDQTWPGRRYFVSGTYKF